MGILGNLLRHGRWHSVAQVREKLRARDWGGARQAIERLHPQTPQLALARKSLAAEMAFHEGRDNEAEAAFREVLREAPGFAEAHYGLSLILLERNEIERALEHAQFAKQADAQEPRFAAQFGLCLLKRGSAPAAEAEFRLAVASDRSDAASWNNLGIVMMMKGNVSEAKKSFRQALALRPDFKNAQDNLLRLQEEVAQAGPNVQVVEVQTNHAWKDAPWAPRWDPISDDANAGNRDAALDAADGLLSEWPSDAELHVLVCRLYAYLGELDDAVGLLEAYLAREGSHPSIHAALGHCLIALQDNARAAAEFQRSIDLAQPELETFFGLAEALHRQEQYGPALAVLLSIPQDQMDDQAKVRIAGSLVANCRYAEALELYAELRQPGRLDPDKFRINYTFALLYSGNVPAALEQIRAMAQQSPGDVNIQTILGSTLLLTHEFGAGWDAYAYRGIAFGRNFRTLPVAKWNGEPLAGKKLIVLAEQALGDQVMFASCLPDLKAQAPSSITVEVIKRVSKTLARSFPDMEVLSSTQKADFRWLDDIEAFDYFVPIGDLPRFFRRSVDSFPRKPYLVADPQRVAYWVSRLQETIGAPPYIGISWRGGTDATRKNARTMQLRDFRPLAELLKRPLVSLQYGEVEADIAQAQDQGLNIVHWPEGIADLDEFAALIAALDGVVTVCNTTVHFTGALGKPGWVLAPIVPEWRYGWRAEFMPWYSEIAVLRQTQLDDWVNPMARAVDAVRDRWFAKSS